SAAGRPLFPCYGRSQPQPARGTSVSRLALRRVEVQGVIEKEEGTRMIPRAGACLCGDLRYRPTAEPVRLTICHCSFCQKLTGSAYLVEPIFRKQDVIFSGTLWRYDHVSDGSHKRVTVNFCGRCGTSVYL